MLDEMSLINSLDNFTVSIFYLHHQKQVKENQNVFQLKALKHQCFLKEQIQVFSLYQV